MKKASAIDVPGVGPVILNRNGRAKRMSIVVATSGVVRITLPCRGTVRQAEEFLREKSDWIAARRRRVSLIRLRHRQLIGNGPPPSRKNAEEVIRGRLDHLARKHGFSFNKVTIRNQKRRWGSCSADNNISINEKLARLPDRLIDFVLLHELVHTRIKNHAKEFWLELGKYVDTVETLRKELRQYRLDLL
jgi:hypothetical protein